MDYKKLAIEKHLEWRGKLEMRPRCPVNTKEELSVAYTPGVAEPCLAIAKDPELSYSYTRRWNTVAVITDGTAVLGLGDIGPEAGMPVMEGKCVLFKSFADIDAIPLCLRTKDVDEIVKAVALLAGSFGGVNLEDISAPRCFEVERRLKEICDIPIFHDDQHGTAVVTLAGLNNAMKITKKNPAGTRAVISGAGAAGNAVARLMLKTGFRDITICNRKGAVSADEAQGNDELNAIAQITNPNRLKGPLAEIIRGADIFIGLSGPGIVSKEMVASMAKDPIVFAMANPVPEIMPDLAKEAGAAVVATGRSDYPNQINNVLAFPGILRGALDVRAKDINDNMKLAAADALASLIPEGELSPEYVIPSPFDKRVCEMMALAVGQAARGSGVARI